MRNEVIFDDWEIPTQTFHLNKSGGRSKEIALQTENSSVDMGIDAVETQEQNIQINMDQPVAGETLYYVSVDDEEINKRVVKFLRKVVPVLDKEIQESYLHVGYQNYDPETLQAQDETKIVAALENVNTDTEGMHISDIDWNSSGTVLAASYSYPIHQGSCSHTSFVSTWNLFKKGLQNATAQTIEINGCVSCLRFHPKKSSILACGTFSGEIYLFNLDKEDDNLVAKTSIDEYFHREVITKLIWWEEKIPGTKQIFHNLLSLSTDGKILLWETKLDEKKPLLQFPLKGFSLLRKRAQEILPVGALTMQESTKVRNAFIVGSEGGSLLQATLEEINHQTKSEAIINVRKGFNYHKSVYPFLLNLPQKSLPDILNNLESHCTKTKSTNITFQTIIESKIQKYQIYPNRISFAYEPSVSPITSISANQHGLLCVNGYEGYCKIYQQQTKECLETIDGGMEVQWLSGTKLGGFFGNEWMVIDWLSEEVVNRIPIAQGIKWVRKGELVAIACDLTQIKLLKINRSVLERLQDEQEKIRQKIEDAKGD